MMARILALNAESDGPSYWSTTNLTMTL